MMAGVGECEASSRKLNALPIHVRYWNLSSYVIWGSMIIGRIQIKRGWTMVGG